MARYDKYDPISGGFRAKLAADWLDADVGIPRGVGLDTNGRIVKGAGNTGIVGILVDDGVPTAGVLKGHKAGDVMDVMTAGEIADVASLTAGTTYLVNTGTGALETVAPAAGTNKPRAGRTVAADRLVVRVEEVQG